MALKTDLIYCLEMNEASGNAIDAHSGGIDWTEINTVAATTGKIGGCRSFVSTESDSFSRADDASISLGSDQDFTFSVWINVTSTGLGDGRAIIDKRTANGSGIEYVLTLLGGAPRLIVGNGTSFAAALWGSAISHSTWYHVTAWHDSAANELGISVNNGTPVTQSWSGGTRDAGATAYIGRVSNSTSTSFHFDGLMDQLAFWKRVLTSGERTEIYNSGNGLAYSSWDAGGGVVLPLFESPMFSGGLQLLGAY